MGQRSEPADNVCIDLHGEQNRGVIVTNENISHVFETFLPFNKLQYTTFSFLVLVEKQTPNPSTRY